MSDQQKETNVPGENQSAGKSNTESPLDIGIESLILIDEHEEEISVDGKTVRRRGIYLLPNF